MTTKDNAAKTYLAMNDAVLQKSTVLLQEILVNSLFMYQLYKKYHWHVTGNDFYQYHILFDKHAGEQLPIIDLVAERLRNIGSNAPGMPEDVMHNTTLHEPTLADNEPLSKVKNLLIVHESFMKILRSAVEVCKKNNDEGTSDLLVSDILRVHELEVWFLRSCLN
jgi:starvation-inducible DNA-binding protein